MIFLYASQAALYFSNSEPSAGSPALLYISYASPSACRAALISADEPAKFASASGGTVKAAAAAIASVRFFLSFSNSSFLEIYSAFSFSYFFLSELVK